MIEKSFKYVEEQPVFVFDFLGSYLLALTEKRIFFKPASSNTTDDYVFKNTFASCKSIKNF
jgi:hypothetical protein